jgi:hypothetical protein
MIVTAETSVRRGRHRRPRPRKVLFAVGGLALAAGVLSLVRMAPESEVGAAGTAEADLRQDPGAGTGTDRSGNAVATVEAVPGVSPSATSAMGGVSATPTVGSSLAPLPASTAPPGPATAVTTTVPAAPDIPAPTTAPQSPTTTPPTPRPTPTPDHPTPQPSRPNKPGLCVPTIGLCVDPLTD